MPVVFEREGKKNGGGGRKEGGMRRSREKKEEEEEGEPPPFVSFSRSRKDSRDLTAHMSCRALASGPRRSPI
jgi:hypothetical protein